MDWKKDEIRWGSHFLFQTRESILFDVTEMPDVMREG